MEERYRLRREIHDTLAQQVGFLTLKARQIRDSLAGSASSRLAQDVAALETTLQDSYQDIRHYLDALSLDMDFSLLRSLQEAATEFAAATGIAVETRLPHRSPGLSPLTELHLMRIAQEALNNIRKHSGARRAWLTLALTHDTVELVVADDGEGFTPGDGPAGNHYGLISMRERARDIGAEITIASAPGQGTQVRVRLHR
jgi:signal transduction histidine kinase